MKFKIDKWKTGLVAIIALTGLIFLADQWFPFQPQIAYSTQIVDAQGNVIHAFLNKSDKWRLYANAADITPLLKKTLIHKEDRFFYQHPGVNPIAMGRALLRNMTTAKRTSGASTITMQVVRLLEPRPRTYASKIIEILRAFQLEMHFSKNEILLMYLNLVPYGGNIEGIKAASLLYFGKQPQLLSLAEITALTIIPNRPSGLRPGSKNEALLAGRNIWLQRFLSDHLFDKPTIEDALDEPLTVKRLKAPALAPHLALRLKNAHPHSPLIEATLNMHLQAQVEMQVKDYVNRLKASNIHNAAVLVVDNETMEIKAYVGSADFANAFDGGQVDGIRAVRSPGSTLKPLLYAMAFDKGMITPKTVINDVPGNFGGFEPENFDGHFNGAVTAEFALAHSLNIPAVKLLKETGTPDMILKLKKAGFETIEKQAKGLGLSMILGGCGVTLEELTRLFAGFANRGAMQPLRFDAREKQKKEPTEIVSEEAAFLTTSILTQISRPDLPANFDNTFHLPRIAWKTGTSYGKRDAWSIGYNKRFTVGVWVGNFSGAGVPDLSGANTATPLLFSIFNALDYNSPKGWYAAPPNVATRNVCPVTGDVPSEFCEHAVTDQYIVGISRNARCSHMRWVFTDLKEKTAYCTYCMEGHVTKKVAFPNLAPELIAYYETQQIPYQKIPPHNPDCERVVESGAPLIVSPNDGSEYFLNPSEPQQLELASQSANDVREVFWYVNDKFAGRSLPGRGLFIDPPRGLVKISCSDDKGRNADIQITVRRQ